MTENVTAQEFGMEVVYTVAVIAAAGVVIYVAKRLPRKTLNLIRSRKLNGGEA